MWCSLLYWAKTIVSLLRLTSTLWAKSSPGYTGLICFHVDFIAWCDERDNNQVSDESFDHPSQLMYRKASLPLVQTLVSHQFCWSTSALLLFLNDFCALRLIEGKERLPKCSLFLHYSLGYIHFSTVTWV